jgi:arylsulfatase A-like enzyme
MVSRTETGPLSTTAKVTANSTLDVSVFGNWDYCTSWFASEFGCLLTESRSHVRLPIAPVLLALCTVGVWADQPNIIVIFTDDQGYADLSCQGSMTDIKTPHIDSLASSGVRMTDGYVTAPQCVPSRAGLLTGRYQNRFGVESNGCGPLPLSETTIADRLKAAGYMTGMIGKWHLSPNHSDLQFLRNYDSDVRTATGRATLKKVPNTVIASYRAANRGFQDFFEGPMYTIFANFDLDGNSLHPNGEIVHHRDRYRLDIQSDAAVAFIRRNHARPFFLYLAYFAPHVPLEATEKYLSRFPGEMPERRRYALAMMSAIDDGVGRILDSLQQYGVDENTLIFFISDNGAPLKISKEDKPISMTGGAWDGSLNEPLCGEKGMLTEGGIRVPFIAQWKGRLPAGTVFKHPVISLDVAATAAALAGQAHDPRLDGVNLIPYLTGEKTGAPHETLYWRWIAQSAVREGKWKYLRGGAREFLFDLDNDKEEQHNLLDTHPEIAQRLADKLEQWSTRLTPTGLEKKQMNKVWERYYDHYLDQN